MSSVHTHTHKHTLICFYPGINRHSGTGREVQTHTHIMHTNSQIIYLIALCVILMSKHWDSRVYTASVTGVYKNREHRTWNMEHRTQNTEKHNLLMWNHLSDLHSTLTWHPTYFTRYKISLFKCRRYTLHFLKIQIPHSWKTNWLTYHVFSLVLRRYTYLL